MQRNKIFRYRNQLRTFIRIDGCLVQTNNEIYDFPSEQEAEAFFESEIQQLLKAGWEDSESIASDKNSTNLNPDEFYRIFSELEERLDEFAASTEKPYLEITTHSTEETTLWQSKFGGVPYFPKGIAYPTRPDGTPLHLLAQINFAEVPTLEDFPKQGILQFYIDCTEQSAYGLVEDSQTEQSTFRILYFPEPDLNIDNLLNNFDFLPEPWRSPVEGCLALNFAVKAAPMSGSDYQFSSLIKRYFPILQESAATEGINEALGEIADDLTEEYDERYHHLLAGHRLGGYPKFAQADPRDSFVQEEGYDFLLFQMDSDQENSIMWGDAGVGHFYIQPSALKRLDFSNVLYTYACS